MAPSSTSPTQTPSPTQDKDQPSKPGEGLWTIQSIPGKGKGVIASKAIKPGTCLISEIPLLTTSCIVSISTTESDLARALRSLPKDSQRAFLSLHNNYPGKNPLSNIIRSNGYPLGPGSEVGGVFEYISRFNHSCRPNAVHAWNPIREQETVYAVRDISEGEEITLSYHAGGPSSTRKEILKDGFGFDCTCEICSLPSYELSKSDARLIRAQNLDATIGDPQTVRFSPGKVLKNCRKLLGIYGEEGIKDDRISRVYFDAFQVANMHGDKARAGIFAERYCREKMRNAGKDGADFWEVRKFVKRPEEHDSFERGQWDSEVKSAPKDLDKEEFERWLWRDN